VGYPLINKYHRPRLFWFCLALIGTTLCSIGITPTFARPGSTPAQLTSSPSERGRIARGGRLYDNWAVTLKKAQPTTIHPSYPKIGKAKAGFSWRCSTCHGWDYKGAAGINKKGSKEYTGIIGLTNMIGVEQKTIRQHIRNKHHHFSQSLLPDDAVADLALFISKGQLNTESLIKQSNMKVKGRPQEGSLFFHTICVRCHGVDGRHINFNKKGSKPIFLGTIAKYNPWKALHKIRNGQPGTIMISFITLLNEQDLMNILSYVQTLPEK
jgi:cytochrome c553